MKFSSNTRRSFEVLAAFCRHGCHELGAMLFGPGTATAPPELGMIATKTPSQIAEGLRNEPEPMASSFADWLNRAGPEPSRGDKQLERDMERD